VHVISGIAGSLRVVRMSVPCSAISMVRIEYRDGECLADGARLAASEFVEAILRSHPLAVPQILTAIQGWTVRSASKSESTRGFDWQMWSAAFSHLVRRVGVGVDWRSFRVVHQTHSSNLSEPERSRPCSLLSTSIKRCPRSTGPFLVS